MVALLLKITFLHSYFSINLNKIIEPPTLLCQYCKGFERDSETDFNPAKCITQEIGSYFSLANLKMWFNNFSSFISPFIKVKLSFIVLSFNKKFILLITFSELFTKESKIITLYPFFKSSRQV